MADDKPCYNCVHLQRYYIKGSKHFQQTKFGRCSRKDETVNIHCTCDKWLRKPMHRKSSMFIKSYLNDLLIEIAEIRGLIEDEINN